MKKSTSDLNLSLKKFINLEPLRFVIAGGINTVLTYGIYAGVNLFLPYSVAYTFSYVSGVVISYVLNSLLVFEERMTIGRALKYPFVYVAQYATGLILMFILVDILNTSEFIAPLVVVGVTLPITFLLSRAIIRS